MLCVYFCFVEATRVNALPLISGPELFCKYSQTESVMYQTDVTGVRVIGDSVRLNYVLLTFFWGGGSS